MPSLIPDLSRHRARRHHGRGEHHHGLIHGVRRNGDCILPVRRGNRREPELTLGDLRARPARADRRPHGGKRDFRGAVPPPAAAGLVIVVAHVFMPVDLSAVAWLRLGLVLAASSVPLSLLGVAIGYWVSSRAALPVANIAYLGLAFAGGLFVPPQLSSPTRSSAILPLPDLQAYRRAGVERGRRCAVVAGAMALDRLLCGGCLSARRLGLSARRGRTLSLKPGRRCIESPFAPPPHEGSPPADVSGPAPNNSPIREARAWRCLHWQGERESGRAGRTGIRRSAGGTSSR